MLGIGLAAAIVALQPDAVGNRNAIPWPFSATIAVLLLTSALFALPAARRGHARIALTRQGVLVEVLGRAEFVAWPDLTDVSLGYFRGVPFLALRARDRGAIVRAGLFDPFSMLGRYISQPKIRTALLGYPLEPEAIVDLLRRCVEHPVERESLGRELPTLGPKPAAPSDDT